MDRMTVAEVLQSHILLAGDGYHRTRSCSCGQWKTRNHEPSPLHNLHLADLIIELIGARP